MSIDTTRDQLPDEDLDLGGGAENNGTSFLDQIKRRRRELGEERWTIRDVPGYDGDLAIKYHYVDGMWEEMKKIVERAEKSNDFRRELYASAEVLLIACSEVLVKDPDRSDADKNGYAPIIEGKTTKLDSELAELLEIPAKRARDIVLGLFRNDLAVTAEQNEVMLWAQSSQSDLDRDVEGESEGTTR